MCQRFFVFLSLVLLAACTSGGAKYNAGWVTHEITGKVEPADTFILVEREDQTFLSSGDSFGAIGQPEYLKRAAARIIKPDSQGNYSVRLPDEASRVSLFFIATGKKPTRKAFQRSIGVGVIELDVKLEETDNFKNIYYLNLRPYLSGFITEKGYNMPKMQQLFLGQWMQKVEQALE